MAQMPVVEEGAEPPPYFPRTLVMLRVGMQPVTLCVTNGTDCRFSEPGA